MRRMLPIIAAVTLLLTVPSGLPRANVPAEALEWFERGNMLYQNRDFAGAREAYEKIVQMGIESPEVYYNLGNTHARLGDNGRAVLWYERARRFSPRDPDLLANLRRVAPVSGEDTPGILTLPFVTVLETFSLREWMLAFLTVFWAAGILGFVLMSRGAWSSRAWLRRAFWTSGTLVLIVGMFAGAKYRDSLMVARVVLVTDLAAVRSGPGEKFNELARFRAGTKLRRLAYDDGAWMEVVLPDGRKGFVQKLAAERL
jgi:tetratricopeptide (TPR) repeat protein